ncbi:MAG TPA: NAD(P)H-dependent oxidoreductase subunit E, partial [Gemmobacter sp.]|nr:NAD(P)H-dependent oxidoreductase subunit E [Gemmobacter sp.]
GACANAPMAQIGKDYYEDLSPARLREMIAKFSAGEVPTPGSQIGRFSSEPASGLTALTEYESGRTQYNASVQLAVNIGDTVKRIDGTEVPLLTPWRQSTAPAANAETAPTAAAKGIAPEKAEALATGKPEVKVEAPAGVAMAAPGQNTATGDVAPAAEVAGTKPLALAAARDGQADKLQAIEGIGPVLEKLCHELGIFHFDQIAAWGPAEIAWMDSNLKGFRGRVTRDKWVSQAKIIVTEGMEAFLVRAKTNDY